MVAHLRDFNWADEDPYEDIDNRIANGTETSDDVAQLPPYKLSEWQAKGKLLYVNGTDNLRLKDQPDLSESTTAHIDESQVVESQQPTIEEPQAMESQHSTSEEPPAFDNSNSDERMPCIVTSPVTKKSQFINKLNVIDEGPDMEADSVMGEDQDTGEDQGMGEDQSTDQTNEAQIVSESGFVTGPRDKPPYVWKQRIGPPPGIAPKIKWDSTDDSGFGGRGRSYLRAVFNVDGDSGEEDTDDDEDYSPFPDIDRTRLRTTVFDFRRWYGSTYSTVPRRKKMPKPVETVASRKRAERLQQEKQRRQTGYYESFWCAGCHTMINGLQNSAKPYDRVNPDHSQCWSEILNFALRHPYRSEGRLVLQESKTQDVLRRIFDEIDGNVTRSNGSTGPNDQGSLTTTVLDGADPAESEGPPVPGDNTEQAISLIAPHDVDSSAKVTGSPAPESPRGGELSSVNLAPSSSDCGIDRAFAAPASHNEALSSATVNKMESSRKTDSGAAASQDCVSHPVGANTHSTKEPTEPQTSRADNSDFESCQQSLLLTTVQQPTQVQSNSTSSSTSLKRLSSSNDDEDGQSTGSATCATSEDDFRSGHKLLEPKLHPTTKWEPGRTRPPIPDPRKLFRKEGLRDSKTGRWKILPESERKRRNKQRSEKRKRAKKDKKDNNVVVA